MKQSLLLLLLCIPGFIAYAQTNAVYDRRWSVVDSLIQKKGLTVSALDEVDKIYGIARREKNEPQLIKALVYRLRLEQKRSDKGLPAAIHELQLQVDSSKSEPTRSILTNMLAGLYAYYLQQNGWRMAGRTPLLQSADTDITTWPVTKLGEKTRELYLSSLKAERLLILTDVAAYRPIVLPGQMPELRPTLFDLLAHRALDYFKTADSYQLKPTHPYTLDDPALFDDAAAFARHSWVSDDSLSGHYQAIRLMQRLTRLHLNDARPEALISLEIERYNFVNTNNTEHSEAAYLQALARLTAAYPRSPAAAEAWYLQAHSYSMHAVTAGLAEDSTGGIKAKEICDRVIAEPDSSEGKEHCIALLQQLLRKEVHLETEKVNIPYKPFRTLVTWKNSDRLYLRLIRLSDDSAGTEMRKHILDSIHLQQLLARPVFRTFTQDLPEIRDYRSHTVETAIASLPPGAYALLISPDSSWSGSQGVMALQYLTVSSISYLKQGNDYFVVNRETGKPIAGAMASLSGLSYTTDGDGHFTQKLEGTRNNLQLLEISAGNDHLWPMEGDFETVEPEDTAVVNARDYEIKYARCFLFADRSIYRPGQTLYFKGILTTLDAASRRPKPLAGFATTVFLYNLNREVIDSLAVTTNDYGSYHGSFRFPVNQLNGVYVVGDHSGGELVVDVEEYKRPRFYVDYEKQKGTYRVGDSIRVTGTAKGYAGNGIDGAKVSYRVVRKTRFPYSWMFWRTNLPGRPDQEIVSGTMTTDAAGKFSFVFYASPDQQARRDYHPEFDYQVNADVTDIAGETRTGVTDIAAGYTSVRLSLELPGGDHQSADSLRWVLVSAKNLAGEPVKADVHVTIYPLQAPQRLIRKRLWAAPDRYIYSEKEWLDSFPHDEYRSEAEKQSWSRGASLWDTTSNTGGARLAPPRRFLAPGWYVIEASTTDNSGQEIKDLQYVELYDGKTGRPANAQYNWELGGTQTVEPGGKAITGAGSSVGDVYVIRSVIRKKFNPTAWKNGSISAYTNDFVSRFSHYTLNGERKETEWAITEDDRGGFEVVDAYVKDNRLYTQATVVQVPWSNKELDIRYASFRDKTEPGSAEKWQMTISGSHGDKVSAEVLTTLYDASLDQYLQHSWMTPPIYDSFAVRRNWNVFSTFGSTSSQMVLFDRGRNYYFSYEPFNELLQPLPVEERVVIGYNGRAYRNSGYSDNVMLEDTKVVMTENLGLQRVMIRGTNSAVYKQDIASDSIVLSPASPAVQSVRARTDFRETAFFFPDLQTDSAGDVRLSFTMPEALTTWKWMTLASTRDLAFGYSTRSVITQKELMVQPNAPRFLREGDKMELQVKVVNMTDSELTGQMSLQLTDPTTGQTADGWFVNREPNQYFTVGARQSFVVGFPLDIPYLYNRPVTYRVVAQAGQYSDGEEAILPVVSNRMLVTESLPLSLPGDGTRHFSFDKLLQSGGSETLNHHALTVEFTANPAWYAIQSLSYLTEYPYACAEQTFERAYANALAGKIVTGAPRLRQVFEKWRTADTAMFQSNLEKNQELKTVLLEETPWVLQGKTEAEQKKNIALLFDMSRMSGALESALDQLQAMQSASGGFPWFKGGMDDRYITQYILTGIGHLQKLQAIPAELSAKVNAIVAAALPYLDGQLKEDYAEQKDKPGWLGALPIQYLYMRSLFSDYAIPGDVFPAVNYFRKKAQQGWVERNNYLKGMIALALYRTGDVQTAAAILASLRQNAIQDPEKGMFWKGMEGGYFWYEAPVETQALLIEAFHEIGSDAATDRQLKTWLLRQKQTHSWPTTTATADACYALLLGTPDWLNAERSVDVRLGDKTIEWPSDAAASGAPAAQTAEPGVGYYKKVFDGPFVNPSMGNITVTMHSKGGGGSPAWGAVYWQYFDMLDHITPTGGGKPVLGIAKKLYLRRNTDHGPMLDTLADNATLHSGDRVVVRMIVRADRDLEYVHIKDMRAACMEPEQVLSGYKWEDGLSYYATTKDASTDLFFSSLPRGTHVIEYTLFAGQVGNFSNGVTTIECLYAPEFSFHSEGIRVNVEAAPGN
jgi:Bacterial Alpha-2-macroglobulin MG10 domain/Alpha-2-macroglobulin family/MG2 domain